MSANVPSQTVFSIGYDFHVGNGTSGNDNGNVWNIYNYRDRSRYQGVSRTPCPACQQKLDQAGVQVQGPQ